MFFPFCGILCFLFAIRLPGHPADVATFGDKRCGTGGAFRCLGWNLWMD